MNNVHEVRKQLANKFLSLGHYAQGVEIGVNEGEYSDYILSNCFNIVKLYSVDFWRGYNELDATARGDFEAVCAMREAADKLTKHGDRSVIIRATSAVAAPLFKDGSLDFVYIDAGHDYKSVVEDIKEWLPKVRKGGLICGDDYVDGIIEWNGKFTAFDVKRAVNEIFGDKVQADPVSQDGTYLSQWWVEV